MNDYLKTYKGTGEKKKLPFLSKIIFLLTAITAVLHVISFFSEGFANFFNRYISSAVRGALALITNLIPFSLAEMLLILLPIIAVLLIVYALRRYSDSWRSVLVYVGIIISVLCVFYILFFWGFGVGYNTTSLDRQLELDRQAVSAEELQATAIILAEKANEEAKNVDFRSRNFSVMPYSISELSGKLNSSYASFRAKNGLVSGLKSNIKSVMLSEAMSYTHITGVYSFFTGEANINVNFPDYTLPFTAAHEMAHQRGIAREDEANFIAFLVCIESDDAYIRYSGYVNMLEYVLNALFGANEGYYKDVVKTVNTNILYEFVSYSDFFSQYRNSHASKVSSAVNDTYLKLNGTEGEKSYGMVVDLAVAYYKSKK